ncbi:Acylphosphatase-like domain-containing protein, partial [Schizophyllum commune]
IAFTVHGLVQGWDRFVVFRNFAVQRAVSEHVTGWVKNAQDGTVVGEAQGDEQQLEKFIKHLNQGPPAANVTKVEQRELEAKEGEDDFQRRR